MQKYTSNKVRFYDRIIAAIIIMMGKKAHFFLYETYDKRNNGYYFVSQSNKLNILKQLKFVNDYLDCVLEGEASQMITKQVSNRMKIEKAAQLKQIQDFAVSCEEYEIAVLARKRIKHIEEVT